MHKNIRVFGRVQGVFFRVSAQDAAAVFDIKGIVKNEASGSVYIEAEGRQTDLNRFIRWCKNGPRLASVTELEMEDGKFIGYQTFEITR